MTASLLSVWLVLLGTASAHRLMPLNSHEQLSISEPKLKAQPPDAAPRGQKMQRGGARKTAAGSDPMLSVEISESFLNTAFEGGWETHLLEESGEHRTFGLTSEQLIANLLPDTQNGTCKEETKSWINTTKATAQATAQAIACVLNFEGLASSPKAPRVSIHSDSIGSQAGISIMASVELGLNALLYEPIAVKLGLCPEKGPCPIEARRVPIANLGATVKAKVKAKSSGTTLSFDLGSIRLSGMDVGLAGMYLSGLSELTGVGAMFEWLGEAIHTGANAMLKLVVNGFLRDIVANQELDLKEMLTVEVEGKDTLRFQDISIQHHKRFMTVSAAVYPAEMRSIGKHAPMQQMLTTLYPNDNQRTDPAGVVQISEDAFNSIFAAGYHAHMVIDGQLQEYGLTSAEIMDTLFNKTDNGMTAWAMKKLFNNVLTFEAIIEAPKAAPHVEIHEEGGLTLTFDIKVVLNGLLWESVAGTKMEDRRVPLYMLAAKASVGVETQSDGSSLSFDLQHARCHDLDVGVLGIEASALAKIPGIGKAMGWLGEKLKDAGNALTEFAVNHIIQGALSKQKVDLSELLLLQVDDKDTLQVDKLAISHKNQALVLSVEVHRILHHSLGNGREWSAPRWVHMPESVKHCTEVTAFKKVKSKSDGVERICVKDRRKREAGCFKPSTLSKAKPAACEEYQAGVGTTLKKVAAAKNKAAKVADPEKDEAAAKEFSYESFYEAFMPEFTLFEPFSS